MTDPRKLITHREALALAGGISDSTRQRLPDFPKAVVLMRDRRGHPIRIAFVEDEVFAWNAARIAERDAQLDQADVGSAQ